MASYIDDTLLPDETVQYRAGLSLWPFAGYIILGFFLLALYGAGLLLWAYIWLVYVSTEVAVTNKRVIAKFGFISRSTVEINLKKVESLQVHQGILARIFGYGTIIISGAGNPQAPIPGIKDPLTFRREFNIIQERAI